MDSQSDRRRRTAFFVFQQRALVDDCGRYGEYLARVSVFYADDLREALYSSERSVGCAQLEGVQGIKLFRYVLLPFVRNILMSCIFLCFIWTFNAYDIMKVMTNGGPAEMTTTMSLLIQREAFTYFSLSNAATMSVYMFCVMLIVVGIGALLRLLIGGKNYD